MLEWLLCWNVIVSKRFTGKTVDRNFPGKEMNQGRQSIDCLWIKEAQISLQFFAHALYFGGSYNNQTLSSLRTPLRSIFYFPWQGSLLDISTCLVCCHLQTTLSGFIQSLWLRYWNYQRNYIIPHSLIPSVNNFYWFFPYNILCSPHTHFHIHILMCHAVFAYWLVSLTLNSPYLIYPIP